MVPSSSVTRPFDAAVVAKPPADRGDDLGVPESVDPGEVDVAPDAVNDDERKIGHLVAPATISIMEVTVATSRERMAVHRERRRSGLVQFIVTRPIGERGEIVRWG